MAKTRPTAAKEGLTVGERIACPYCGRPGKLVDVSPNGDVFVVHEIEVRDEPCAGQGTMKVERVVDSCSPHLKRRKPNP